MVEADVKAHYVGERGRKYHDEGFSIPHSAAEWVGRLRAEKLVTEVAPEDVVFEYGVGAGWNLMSLPCKRRLGYDLGEHLRPRVEALGIEFLSATVNLPAGSVDAVVCHHVLEHVVDPPTTMAEIRRVLKNKGKLLLYVPFEKEGRYRRFRREEPNHHLYSWNVQSLGNFVEAVGFTVKKASLGQYGYDRFASAWAAQFHLGESGFRLLRSALHLVRPSREVRIVAEK